MRWLLILPIVLLLELFAIPLAFVLPIFAQQRKGLKDNAKSYGLGPRLPWYLTWFDTPDNDLFGDEGHDLRCKHRRDYWQMALWLIRNRCYTFKWTVIAAKVDRPIKWRGDRWVNRNTGEGKLVCEMGDFWQWKCVKKIPGTSKCLMLNFGWLLDAHIGNEQGQRALYQFSPRIAKFEPKD